MIFVNYCKYVGQYTNFFFLNNTKFHYEDVAFIVSALNTFYFTFFFKYSIFFKSCHLIDIGGYDIPVSNIFKELVDEQEDDSSASTESNNNGGAEGGSRENSDLFYLLLYTTTLWYVFKDLVGKRLFVFSLQTKNTIQSSIDTLFRNAR